VGDGFGVEVVARGAWVFVFVVRVVEGGWEERVWGLTGEDDDGACFGGADEVGCGLEVEGGVGEGDVAVLVGEVGLLLGGVGGAVLGRHGCGLVGCCVLYVVFKLVQG
jgi:hypothetical protein